MGSLYGRPNKSAYVIQQNFLSAHSHCLNSEAKGELPSSPAKGSKLHIQIPAEDLQEFNRNNDSLFIKWLPGTKALYTSYSNCLNDAFRKKKKSHLLCMDFTVPRLFFFFPYSLPPRKKSLHKRKRILSSRVTGQILLCIGGIYHSSNCLSTASDMIWYYFKLDTF